jgi:hypothetical protein
LHAAQQHEVEAVTRLQENLSDSLSGDSFENFGFNVHTSKNGYNCGREYCFSVESQVHLEDWLSLVSKSAKLAKMKFAKRTLIETYRVRILIHHLFLHPNAQSPTNSKGYSSSRIQTSGNEPAASSSPPTWSST